MWPFKSKNIPTKVIEDSIDELGLVRLNGLHKAVEQVMKKHLDATSLEDFADDQGGYFQPEFNLVTTAGRMKSVYKREPWVNVTASIIAKTLATIPYDVIDKSTNEVDLNHPMNEILKMGNQLQDGFTLDWSGNLDLVLSGNFFQVLDGDKILHIPVEYVTIRVSTNEQEFKKFGPIMGIEVNGSVSANAVYEKQFIPWSDVIHFKLPNPFNPYIGMSLISAASRPILLDRHKNEFEMAFYLRGGSNSGVIETTEDITKQRMERLMRTFEASMTGRRNWWRQLFLPKGAKWVNSGLTMTEMQHLEGLRENRLTLLAVIGVPPMKVGIVQDVNRATSETQDKTFYENTIIPLSKLKAAGWNNSYLVKRKFKDEIEIRPNFDGIEAIEGGILTRATQAKALDNIATVNEQRKIAGLSPLKSTDPRGNLFAVELSRFGLTPFGAEPPRVEPEEMGPEDAPVGEMHEVEIENGNGENEHTHIAEVDSQGNGKTTSTSGDGPKHIHEILAGEVQVGGVDGHSHPSIDVSSMEEEKRFRRIKAQAVDNQENIEKNQGGKYFKAYQRHLTIKLEQAKRALRQDKDVQTELANGLQLRMNQYQKDAIPILSETMERGFSFAQSQTRGIQNVSKKVFDFSPQDELAIEIIQDSTRAEQNKLLELRGIERFLGIDETENNHVFTLIAEGLERGETTEQIAKELEQKYGERYGDQAFTITRTETLFSVSEGLNWQKETLDTVFTEVNKQWFHVGDVGSNPMAREAHAAFEKEGRSGVVPGNHVWVNGETGAQLRYPRDPQAGAADVINCFVADMKIESHSIKNAFKRFYRGPLITVKLENGREITGTPNHPMLTTKGWVSLGKLNKSHKLIKARVGNNRIFSSDVNIGGVPTKIGDFFTTFSKSGNLKRVAGRVMDFHGDGTNADIQIVFPQSLLMNSRYVNGGQSANNIDFQQTGFRQRTLFSNSRFNESIGGVFPSNGFVSSFNLSSSLLGSPLTPFDSFGFRTVSLLQSEQCERSSNGDATNTKLLRQFIDANAFIDVECIDISDVVVRKNSWGHVYNLSTENEMYTVEGVITHNCRCSMVNVIPKTAESNADQIIQSQ